MEKVLNMEYLKGKKILITGGLGFAGVNLVSKLLSHKINPTILEFIAEDVHLDTRYIPFNLEKIELMNIDIRNQKEIIKVIKNVSPDYVVHLAANTELKKDFETAFNSVETNIKGTLNLLKAIKKFPVNNFIFMSSSDVYGGTKPPFHEEHFIIPSSPYSVSKASAEMYCLMFNRVYKLPITILRSFNLFGEFQRVNRVIPYIIMKLIKNEKVELTKGEQKREFNYIENLLDAIFLSLKIPESQGRTFNIGSGFSISIRDIAEKIAEEFELKKNLELGAIPYRANEIWDMYCDNTLAKNVLGWEPRVSLTEGLIKTINWYKDIFS